MICPPPGGEVVRVRSFVLSPIAGWSFGQSPAGPAGCAAAGHAPTDQPSPQHGSLPWSPPRVANGLGGRVAGSRQPLVSSSLSLSAAAGIENGHHQPFGALDIGGGGGA